MKHICLKFVKELPKKMKRFNTITGIMDTGLVISTVITGGISIAAYASGVGLPVGISLSGTSLLLSTVTVIVSLLLLKEVGYFHCNSHHTKIF